MSESPHLSSLPRREGNSIQNETVILFDPAAVMKPAFREDREAELLPPRLGFLGFGLGFITRQVQISSRR